MTLSLPYFVDAHCHLFSISDIPLWKPISQLTGLHPIAGMIGGAYVGILAKKKIPKYKPFIQYFEREQVASAIDFAGQVESAKRASGITSQTTLCTPLIMDFDRNGEVDKLTQQVERLVDVSDRVPGLKVLPFLGLDPRRHVYRDNGNARSKAQMLNHLEDYLAQFSIKSKTKRKLEGNLVNGDILGVKLYPPLGFHPLPDANPDRSRHLDFYERISEKGLPITVHCQHASFNLVNGRDSKRFTKPDNWKQVLDGLEERGVELKINFGHFGGDHGVEGLLPRHYEFDEREIPWRHFRRSSWTFKILRLLEDYPNTYADISAINFDPKTRNQDDVRRFSGLLWFLVRAYERSESPDRYSVFDKLLWGSDFPMPLTEAPDYTHLLQNFITAYTTLPGSYGNRYPEADRLPPIDFVLRKLCCDNPMRFLFGMNVGDMVS